MVNGAMTMSVDPWHDLAIGYAPVDARAALEALFALDAALGNVLRTTREPLVGQMRLAWWRDALLRLDTAPPPAEPVLQALAAMILPFGITGQALVEVVDGWEALLGDLDHAAIDDHARLRGRLLFELAARALGAGANDPVGDAGEGWALADLSGNLRDARRAAEARERAITALERATAGRWSRNGRTLGALALIARRQLAGPPAASFVFRLALFRLTGR